MEDRILEEIEGIVAARKAQAGEVEEELVFQPEEVKRMEYLHAALSEALRLYPSVPVDHKEVQHANTNFIHTLNIDALHLL